MSQELRGARGFLTFDYEGETYGAVNVPTNGSQVLHMPDGKFLEPTSWIHSKPRPRIGFAHVFTQPRAGAEAVEVWKIIDKG